MAASSEAMFNKAFETRFKDLSSLYDSPASSDVSFLISDGAPMTGKAVKNASMTPTAINMPSQPSCSACEALAKPMPCAEPSKNMLSGGTSWLLGLLLVVGVFLVIFGIYQLFRSSSDRNRNPIMFPPKIGLPSKYHGAPHLPNPAGTFGPLATDNGANGDGIDENDPDLIIPNESDNGVSIVFFHATWCGHCKQFRPIFEEAAAAHGGRAKFKAVVSDVLQKSKHADKVPIQGFPTVFVFKDGQPVDSMVGNQGKDALMQLIAKHTAP